MNTLNPKVDLYLKDGCGRCKFYATPQCKVNSWVKELEALRQIVLDCGLTEDLKWGVPVYTVENKNIAIVSAFKEFCSLNFFKGVLLSDPKNILQKQGESSQSARLIKFTNTKQIQQLKPELKKFILQAVELEKSGAKVIFKQNPEPVPEELQIKFKLMPVFKKAFFALTPGRQRGYIIYFSQPKQAGTRTARIEKCIEKIMKGEGLNDNYRAK